MTETRETHDEGANGALVPGERAPPMGVDETGMFVTRNSSELWRVAKMLLATGAAPKSYREPQQVVVAIQALKSMGLNPYVSLRQTGMINGSFTIWGDLPLALVRAGGEVEWVDEFYFTMREGEYLRQCFDNGNCHEAPFGAVCRIKRRGHPEHESVFTMQQAKQANLLGKSGPWTQYTDRMLRYRARSGALKDVFSDGLQGVAIKEYDIEGVDRKDARVVDFKPGHSYGSIKPPRQRPTPTPTRGADEVQRMRRAVEDLRHKDEDADRPSPSASAIPEESVVEADVPPNREEMSEEERMEAALVAMRDKGGKPAFTDEDLDDGDIETIKRAAGQP